MKMHILIAQIIFGGIGLVFLITSLIAQFTWRPSMWYSGPTPLAGIIIGLIPIAIVFVLQGKHKE
jgi:hypothetical protein